MPPRAQPRSKPSASPREAESRSQARLSWPGRRWEPGERGEEEAPTLVDVERVGDAGETRPEAQRTLFDAPSQDASDARGGGRLVHGEALDVVRALAAEGLTGQVDLVYVDPPFASQVAYTHEARLDGPADGRVVRTLAYDDRWDVSLAEYLDMLAPTLDGLAHLLAPGATLWVHVDWRASHLVRLLLDEILGREAFVNEIVWRRAPNLGRQAASHQFGRTLDTLVVYGKARGDSPVHLTPPTRLEPIEDRAVRTDEKGRPFTSAPRGDYTDESIARLDAEGRVHRTASGKVYIKYFLVKNDEDQWCRERRVDALWTDVPPLRHARPGERTGYPTQKPRALLDRVVACASPPGGLVVDVFAGSGTTGESAHALGRRFVLGDASPLALSTARARLLRAGAPLQVQSCGGLSVPVGEAPRVRIERKGGGVRVTLEAPEEPLAWAIHDAAADGLPVATAWHSERAPGKKPVPAERVASLERAPGLLGVRVWYDDGRVGTLTTRAP